MDKIIAWIMIVILMAVSLIISIDAIKTGKITGSGRKVVRKENPISYHLWLLSYMSPFLFCSYYIIGISINKDSETDIKMEITIDISQETESFSYTGPGFHRDFIVSRKDNNTEVKFSSVNPPPNQIWELNGLNDKPEFRVIDINGQLITNIKPATMKININSKGSGILKLISGDKKASINFKKGNLKYTIELLKP